MKTSNNVKTLIRGEKRRFFLNIYQPVDDSNLDSNCNPQRNELVIPPTITITSSTYDVYYQTDYTTPILSGAASITNILDSTSTIVGFKLSIVIDTTLAAFSEDGDYLLVFTYEEDSAEIFMIQCPFRVESLDSQNSSC